MDHEYLYLMIILWVGEMFVWDEVLFKTKMLCLSQVANVACHSHLVSKCE